MTEGSALPLPILASATGPVGLRDIFLRIPDQAPHLVDFYELLMRGPSPLSAGEREAIYAYCSKLNGCHFAHTSHRTCAVALGIDDALFSLGADALHDAPLTPEMRRLLAFAAALTLVQRDRARVYQLASQLTGIDQRAVADTVLVTGLTAYINRVLDGLGAAVADETHRRNGIALAENGYRPVRAEVDAAARAAGLAEAAPLPHAPTVDLPDIPMRQEVAAWLASYRAHVMSKPGGLPPDTRHVIWTAVRDVIHSDDAASTDPLIEHVRGLSRHPRSHGPADGTPLYRAGHSDDEIIDATVVCALANFAERTVVAADALSRDG